MSKIQAQRSLLHSPLHIISTHPNRSLPLTSSATSLVTIEGHKVELCLALLYSCNTQFTPAFTAFISYRGPNLKSPIPQALKGRTVVGRCAWLEEGHWCDLEVYMSLLDSFLLFLLPGHQDMSSFPLQ